MKKLTNFILALVLISLYSCSGSDTYRGLWKAIDEKGEKFEITFDEKNISMKYMSTCRLISYKYPQNSVSIQNAVET